MDDFKETFKYFKHNRDPKHLRDVINFESPSELVVPFRGTAEENNSCVSCDRLGLVPHPQWEIFTVENADGFVFIRNPFTAGGQKLWIKKCLETYARKPSVTNLDLHHKNVDDVWSLRLDPDPARKKLVDKLSWATFGYHHDWDTKIYDPSNRSPFPECLSELVKHIANRLDFRDFEPEAAIVNYYNSKSCLGIHNDHSELELKKPIVSVSFGQTAVFLLGTESRIDRPIAMYLRSGDIVVMSGPCRLSYHAVPAIIDEPMSHHRYAELGDDENDDWRDFHEYILKHRINISVRQVYSGPD